jgi:hypothetical protein
MDPKAVTRTDLSSVLNIFYTSVSRMWSLNKKRRFQTLELVAGLSTSVYDREKCSHAPPLVCKDPADEHPDLSQRLQPCDVDRE